MHLNKLNSFTGADQCCQRQGGLGIYGAGTLQSDVLMVGVFRFCLDSMKGNLRKFLMVSAEQLQSKAMALWG